MFAVLKREELSLLGEFGDGVEGQNRARHGSDLRVWMKTWLMRDAGDVTLNEEEGARENCLDIYRWVANMRVMTALLKCLSNKIKLKSF